MKIDDHYKTAALSMEIPSTFKSFHEAVYSINILSKNYNVRLKLTLKPILLRIQSKGYIKSIITYSLYSTSTQKLHL